MKWISATEKLPELHVKVLVYVPPSHAIVIAKDKRHKQKEIELDEEVYVDFLEDNYDGVNWHHSGAFCKQRVTHWTPIPKYPKY